MSEKRMADALLFDLLEQHYKAHFVSEYCDNCVSSKPTRVIVTRKLQRFFLCDVCAVKLHRMKREFDKK
jgi:hypothetical protein